MSDQLLRKFLAAAERDGVTHLKPLNGTKTHPLTPASLKALRDLAEKPLPRQELNPGVANRLLREALVESVELPSPYATHKGRAIEHLKASAAGVARLAAN